jgi:hypothetical protein
LANGPADAPYDLEHTDGAGERGSFLQVAHKILPEFGAMFPGQRVVFGTNKRHDAIADEGHGSEVFPASRCEGHFGSPKNLILEVAAMLPVPLDASGERRI